MRETTTPGTRILTTLTPSCHNVRHFLAHCQFSNRSSGNIGSDRRLDSQCVRPLNCRRPFRTRVRAIHQPLPCFNIHSPMRKDEQAYDGVVSPTLLVHSSLVFGPKLVRGLQLSYPKASNGVNKATSGTKAMQGGIRTTSHRR